MLLTIFGAGASYDSVDLSVVPSLRRQVEISTIYRPPLANQLFDERDEFVTAMNQYPQMSGLVPRLRRASQSGGGATIEETLRGIQMEADTFPQRKSHLMALERYLSDIFDDPVSTWVRSAGRATNYVELLDQIERMAPPWPLLFVTFNYDRMLESAFADVLGNRFSGSLNSYIPSEFALIKPHGSVDWIQVLPGEEMLMSTGRAGQKIFTWADIISGATNLDFQDGVIAFRPGRDQTQFPQQWHPAIAIPVDRGKTFVCPPEHLGRLRDDLE